LNLKKVIKLLALFFVFLFLMTGCGTEPIVGTANGENIYKWEYDYFYNQNYLTLLNYGFDMESEDSQQMLSYVEGQSWNYALTNALIRKAAQEQNVEVTDQEVNDELETRKGQTFTTDEDYQNWLTENELTEVHLKELLKIGILSEKLYEQVSKDITVSEEDCRQKYEADPDTYNYRMTSHIIILADQSTATAEQIKAAEASIDEVFKKLDAGEAFATLAQQYSQDSSASGGGVLDMKLFKTMDSIDADYLAAAYQLKNVGDYIKVQSAFGFHIIKLDAIYNTYAAVHDEILATMNEEAKTEFYTNYMDNYSQTADVERKMTFQYWAEGNELPGDPVDETMVKTTTDSDSAETDSDTNPDSTTDDNTTTDQDQSTPTDSNTDTTGDTSTDTIK